jgi:hypothetical protein
MAFTLSQTIKHTITYYEEDFDSEEEYLEFLNKIKTDNEFRSGCFFVNVDFYEYNENNASKISVEEIKQINN